MKKIRRICIGVIGIFVILASCTKRSKTTTSQGILDFSEKISKSWEILNDEDIFVPTYDMFTQDSVLVSLGFLDKKFIHAYSQKDGKLLANGVLRGQGPDDMTTVKNLSKTKDGIAVYDLNARRLKFFNEDFKCTASYQMSNYAAVEWEAIALSDSIALIAVPHRIDDGTEFGFPI